MDEWDREGSFMKKKKRMRILFDLAYVFSVSDSRPFAFIRG